MKILGIDTSTATASVALVENGRLILEEVHSGTTKLGDPFSAVERANHAETLLPLLQRLLKKACLSFQEISALAVSIGPGSFTGLRIGLSTVKGLAYGWEISLVAVPTLLAVAARVTVWQGLICSFLDARKREVYAALFRRKKDGRLERLTGDLVCAPEQMIREIQTYAREPCLLIGEGTRAYGDLIKASLADKALLTLGESYPSTAFSVACIAEGRVRKGDFDSSDLLVPVYLRPSEAELKKRPRNG